MRRSNGKEEASGGARATRRGGGARTHRAEAGKGNSPMQGCTHGLLRAFWRGEAGPAWFRAGWGRGELWAEVMLPLAGKASHSRASPQSPAEESARDVLEGEARET